MFGLNKGELLRQIEKDQDKIEELRTKNSLLEIAKIGTDERILKIREDLREANDKLKEYNYAFDAFALSFKKVFNVNVIDINVKAFLYNHGFKINITPTSWRYNKFPEMEYIFTCRDGTVYQHFTVKKSGNHLLDDITFRLLAKHYNAERPQYRGDTKVYVCNDEIFVEVEYDQLKTILDIIGSAKDRYLQIIEGKEKKKEQ